MYAWLVYHSCIDVDIPTDVCYTCIYVCELHVYVCVYGGEIDLLPLPLLSPRGSRIIAPLTEQSHNLKTKGQPEKCSAPGMMAETESARADTGARSARPETLALQKGHRFTLSF